MAFLFETKSGIGTRRVYSYDGSKTKSAKLIIEYASGSGMGKLEVSLDEMKVYPNPSAANSEFYVELAENMIGQPVQVDLYNTNGQLMFTQEFEQANNILTVPTKNMQSGVYFIQVQSKDYHKTFNIMIGQ